MKIVYGIQAIIVAVFSVVYLPFLSKKKLSLIKEDFKHLCDWQGKELHYFLFISHLLTLVSIKKRENYSNPMIF